MASSVEYGIIAAGIAVVILTAVHTVGNIVDPPKPPLDPAQQQAEVAASCLNWPRAVVEKIGPDFHGHSNFDVALQAQNAELVTVSEDGNCLRVGRISFNTQNFTFNDRIALEQTIGVGPESPGPQYFVMGFDENPIRNERTFVLASGYKVAYHPNS